MPLDPESLYLQLGQLVSETPDLAGPGPITPETYLWLGRAAQLVKESCGEIDAEPHIFNMAADGLMSPIRESNAHQVIAIVHRALARAEAAAPTAARGRFIAVGAQFDALQAVAKVLSGATKEALLIDPYMDAKVLTDFAPTAPEGVEIKLLTDPFYTKADAIRPTIQRWVQQFGATRPLTCRMTMPRALHDRLIVIDGSVAWSLTQSLKDFAGRSPASVLQMPADMAGMKVGFYQQAWDTATVIA